MSVKHVSKNSECSREPGHPAVVSRGVSREMAGPATVRRHALARARMDALSAASDPCSVATTKDRRSLAVDAGAKVSDRTRVPPRQDSSDSRQTLRVKPDFVIDREGADCEKKIEIMTQRPFEAICFDWVSQTTSASGFSTEDWSQSRAFSP